MAHTHTASPLTALSPVSWDTIDQEHLDALLDSTLAAAQLLVDSIPHASASAASLGSSSSSHGRPRSQTDDGVSYGLHSVVSTSPLAGAAAAEPNATQTQLNGLRQAWKEVRVGGGSNVRGIDVFKMSGGRDGYAGSSWFARRSMHQTERRPGGTDVAIRFDAFKRGLLREFALQKEESGAERTGEEGPAVRTMRAKRRVEHIVGGGGGSNGQGGADRDGQSHTRQLSVYLLEADFPGPTAPRDFVTLLLADESGGHQSGAENHETGRPPRPRQLMLVSKPCRHPEAPPRQGFVRAQYESVEVIREVPVARADSRDNSPALLAVNDRRARSSIALGMQDGSDARSRSSSTHAPRSDIGASTDTADEMAIEWLMVTRNNPGGNVPRFLVDRSTPSSIISDANKFMDWLATDEAQLDEAPASPAVRKDPSPAAQGGTIEEEAEHEAVLAVYGDNRSLPPMSVPLEGGAASSTKLFNMFAGAFGGAGTAVASKLPNPFQGAAQVLWSSGLDQPREADGSPHSDDSGGEMYSEIDEGEDGEDGEDSEDSEDRKEAIPGVVPEADSATASARPQSPASTDVRAANMRRRLILRDLDDAFLTTDNDSAKDLFVGTNDGKKSHRCMKTAKDAEAARRRHERALRKLQDHLRRAEEGVLKSKKISKRTDEAAKASEAGGPKESHIAPGRNRGDSEGGVGLDGASSASSMTSARGDIHKLREKHERAVARQEARYQKEVQQLERKQQHQAEKEAARRRKQLKREEKADAARQLEHARAERDVARKEVELLTDQVRQLQARNAMLQVQVERRMGVAENMNVA